MRIGADEKAMAFALGSRLLPSWALLHNWVKSKALRLKEHAVLRSLIFDLKLSVLYVHLLI